MKKEYEVEKCEMCGGDAPVEFMQHDEDGNAYCPNCIASMRSDEIAYAKSKGVDVMELYNTDNEDTE